MHVCSFSQFLLLRNVTRHSPNASIVYYIQIFSRRKTGIAVPFTNYACLQYRYLIPTPADRTSVSASLLKHQLVTYQKNKPSTSMTHAACESKLISYEAIPTSMPGNWVAIWRPVVYYVRAAHAFSARIKCWQCTSIFSITGTLVGAETTIPSTQETETSGKPVPPAVG